MAVDKDGFTPLHLAAKCENTALVECLLLTGKCDPLVMNKAGQTPLQLAIKHTDTLTTLKKFSTIKKHYPIESYVNILLLGNSRAGRSSLGHIITETATGFYYFGEFRNVHGGMPYVADIISNKIQHKIQGNIILHDSWSF